MSVFTKARDKDPSLTKTVFRKAIKAMQAHVDESGHRPTQSEAARLLRLI